MKLSLILILFSISVMAESTYYLESQSGNGYPDLLMHIKDDGTCVSEMNNFDGTKDIMITECEMKENEFIEKKTLSITSCHNDIQQDYDITQNYMLKRVGDTIEVAGIKLVKASIETLSAFEALKSCP